MEICMANSLRTRPFLWLLLYSYIMLLPSCFYRKKEILWRLHLFKVKQERWRAHFCFCFHSWHWKKFWLSMFIFYVPGGWVSETELRQPERSPDTFLSARLSPSTSIRMKPGDEQLLTIRHCQRRGLFFYHKQGIYIIRVDFPTFIPWLS